MPANQGAPGLFQLVNPAPQHGFHDRPVQCVDGESDNGQRRDRFAAHCIHVAQRVRRRNLAEEVRVVNARREHIDRLHERAPVVNLVNARIVAGCCSKQAIRVGNQRQVAQNAEQVGLADFGCASSLPHEPCQRNLVRSDRLFLFSALAHIKLDEHVARTRLLRVTHAMAELFRTAHHRFPAGNVYHCLSYRLRLVVSTPCS